MKNLFVLNLFKFFSTDFFLRLFDICNSRNPIARNFKAPIFVNNKHHWYSFLNEAFTYFGNIRLANNKLVMETKRKTPFVGFLTLITTIKGIYESYIEDGKLK